MYTRPTAPRSIGGVIDDAIKLYVASFRAWIVPAIIGAVLIGLPSGWMQLNIVGMGARAMPAQAFAIFASPSVRIAYFLILLVSVWSTFAIVGAIIRVSRGESPTVAETLRTSLAVLPAALLGSILSGLGIVIGFVLLIIPGIYLIGRWMYWSVSLMDQRGSALDALGRSWQLSKGHWWRGITIITVVVILLIVLSMVGTFGVGIAMGIARADLVTMVMVTQVLQGIMHIFMAGATPAAFAAIYFDLQLRREGGDLAARVGSLTST